MNIDWFITRMYIFSSKQKQSLYQKDSSGRRIFDREAMFKNEQKSKNKTLPPQEELPTPTTVKNGKNEIFWGYKKYSDFLVCCKLIQFDLHDRV